MPEVERETGITRSTIYRRIAQGMFPAGHRLRGGRATVWPEHEIEAWKQDQLTPQA